MATSTAQALMLKNRSAAYGRMKVVTGVTLELKHGEVHAVLGPNGAGKTSLLESVAGRVKGHGEVWVDGQRVDNLSTHRRSRQGLGLVPTGRGLFPSLSVADNLALGSRLAGPDRRADLLHKAMDFFPVLQKRLSQSAGQMSGGEQQMLAIAKALVGDPKVLLLDEPTQGLAPQVLEELAVVITRMCSDGLGVLIAEQNQAFAARVADRYSVLVQGTVTEGGDVATVRERSELFAAYMGVDSAKDERDPAAS